VVRLDNPEPIKILWRTVKFWASGQKKAKRHFEFSATANEGWVRGHSGSYSFAIQCVPSSPNFPWPNASEEEKLQFKTYCDCAQKIVTNILRLLCIGLEQNVAYKGDKNLKECVDEKQSVLKVVWQTTESSGWIPHAGLLSLFPLRDYYNFSLAVKYPTRLPRADNGCALKANSTLKISPTPEGGYILGQKLLRRLVAAGDFIVVPGESLQLLTSDYFIGATHSIPFRPGALSERSDCFFELRPKLDLSVYLKGVLTLTKHKIQELIEPLYSSDPLCSLM